MALGRTGGFGTLAFWIGTFLHTFSLLSPLPLPHLPFLLHTWMISSSLSRARTSGCFIDLHHRARAHACAFSLIVRQTRHHLSSLSPSLCAWPLRTCLPSLRILRLTRMPPAAGRDDAHILAVTTLPTRGSSLQGRARGARAHCYLTHACRHAARATNMLSRAPNNLTRRR